METEHVISCRARCGCLRRFLASILCAGLSLLPACAASQATSTVGTRARLDRLLEVASMQCELSDNTLGIHSTHPHLSWVLEWTEPARRGLRQTAYQILVATSSVRTLVPLSLQSLLGSAAILESLFRHSAPVFCRYSIFVREEETGSTHRSSRCQQNRCVRAAGLHS